MIMKDNKRQMASIIVGRMNKKPENSEQQNDSSDNQDSQDESKSDHEIAMESAGEEIMNAVHSKDSKAVASSIAALMELHSNKESDDEQNGSEGREVQSNDSENESSEY